MKKRILTALDELKFKDFEYKRERYLTTPVHAIPRKKFSDRTANGLTACILKWLTLNGHKAWRQSSEGRYRPGKQYTDVLGHRKRLPGQFIPGTNKGHADVASIIGGRFVAWEVKVGKDRQSEIQKRFQEEVEASGGRYFIARSFGEFLNQYKTLTQI